MAVGNEKSHRTDGLLVSGGFRLESGAQVTDLQSDPATGGLLVNGALISGGGGSPTGPATGDLTGTYPAPTIALLAVTAAKIASLTITDAQVATANKDGAAGTASMRTLGSGATQAAGGTDARLSDSRAPNGAAAGDLTGTYPAPTIAALAVTAAKIATLTITDAQVATANKDGASGVASMRTLGSGATQATSGTDARLSDSRAPNGTATGDLTGSYPAPTIAALAVTAAKIANATITDTQVAAANKDGVAATASMRTLGSGAAQAASGTDARFTDSRAPNGTATGDLTGTYPAPTIAALAVTAAKIATSTITDVQVASANKDGATGTASMRTIGAGALQVVAGNDSRLTDARTPTAHKATHDAQAAGSDPLTGLSPGVMTCAPSISPFTAAGIVAPTALAPYFYPIEPQGLSTFAVTAMRARVRTLLAASTFGIAVYSAAFTASATMSASLVANLSAAGSGAAVGVIQGDIASAPITLNFATTRYYIAVMVSSAVTLALAATAATPAGVGSFKWTAAARASTTDWPASFTQTSVGANASGDPLPWVALLTANGKFLY